MKRIISILLLASILLCNFNFNTFAASDEIIIIPSQDGTIKSTDDCVLSPDADWKISTASTVTGPTGGYSWYTRSKTATATFNASQLESGTYGVYTYILPYLDTPEFVDVTVTASGRPSTIKLNGQIKGWVYLGTYDFNGYELDSVVHQINENTMTENGALRISAVKFIKDDTNTDRIGNLNEIIELKDGETKNLDISSNGFTKSGGVWTSSNLQITEGVNSFYTYEKGNFATWYFNVGATKGVEIFIPKIGSVFGDEDPGTQFEICASGQKHIKTVNFNDYETGWYSLGKYDFSGTSEEYVRIKKVTEGSITRAIGVKLSLNGSVPEIEKPSILTGNEELHIFERLGMYLLDPITEEYMNLKVTRVQMANMLTKLFGKHDDVVKEVTDAKLDSGEIAQFADCTTHKNRKTLAWIRNHPEFGIHKIGSDSFGPKLTATKTTLIKFILHQLGYYEGIDYKSNKTYEFAKKLNIKTDGDENLTVTSMAKILYSAFETPTKNGKETFFQKLVRENSGIKDANLLNRQPLSKEMKKAREESRNADKGISYNNDGNDVYSKYDAYPEPFDASQLDATTINTANFLGTNRAKRLATTEIGRVFYCTGVFNSYTHSSEETDLRMRDWSYRLKELTGKDTLETMIEHVHGLDKEIFWSMRVNDTHDSDYGEEYLDSWKKANLDKLVSRKADALFMVAGNRRWSAVDFTYTESRQKVYNIFKDVISRYDVDGLEIDFTRHPVFFKEVTMGIDVYPENVERMNNLVRMLRALTEQYSMERGKPLLLTIIVPDSLTFCKAVGLDIETWIKEDLIDMTAIGWHSGYFQSWEDSVKEYDAITEKYGLDRFPVYALIDPSGYLDSPTSAQKKQYDFNEAYMAYEGGVKGIYGYNNFNVNDNRYDLMHSKETIPADQLIEGYVSKHVLYGHNFVKDGWTFVTLNK